MDELQYFNFAQPVPLHYLEEKFSNDVLEKNIRLQLAEQRPEDFSVLTEKELRYFKNLELVLLELSQIAVDYLHTIHVQQHATTTHLSERTLRNCFAYAISVELPFIIRILTQMNKLELNFEILQHLLQHIPRFIVLLDSIHRHGNRLPCVVHTKDIQPIISNVFQLDQYSK